MFQELRIEVNKACNFACVHCYTEKRGPEGLPADHFVEAIREAAQRGATDLSLTGGEPLLDLPRTRAMIAAGAEAGLRVRLNTNGWRLTQPVARDLKSCGLDEVQISLNSADATSFDRFVRREGAFERVEMSVRTAAQLGLWVTIRFTLMLLNHQQLVPTFRLAEEWGADRFKVRALVQVHGIREDGWASERDRLREAIDLLVAASTGSRLDVIVADDGIGADLPDDSRCRSLPCKCGANAIFVSADGRIAPCPFLREESEYWLGNLAEDDLFEIYHGSDSLREFIGARTDERGGNECTTTCRASQLARQLEATPTARA
jgi:radical SAM protein with 4Fe4S-binding SPASM domain